MAANSVQKNGHELATAWLRREGVAPRDAFAPRRPPQAPAGKADEERAASPQRVFNRERGFFRA